MNYTQRGWAAFEGVTQVDENGNEVFRQSDVYPVSDALELQEFEANERIVGQVPVAESEAKTAFWVALTPANYTELRPIEVNSGF